MVDVVTALLVEDDRVLIPGAPELGHQADELVGDVVALIVPACRVPEVLGRVIAASCDHVPADPAV